ncbi:MAG: hypothetical protein H7248_02235 [Microbacteriaceae bacterium]|nr:hypothetical protein [Microbacteriaceae bacterium]
MPSKLFLTLAGSAIVIVGLTGCSAGASTPAASASASAPMMASPSVMASPMASPSMAATMSDLSTGKSALGDIVVDGKGMTAYVFDNDVPGSGASMCTGACGMVWPAVVASSAMPKVTGVMGTVGTIPGANGTMQLTINGMPLYTFTKDMAPMDAKGQGVKGVWHALAPSGAKVMAPAAG